MKSIKSGFKGDQSPFESNDRLFSKIGDLGNGDHKVTARKVIVQSDFNMVFIQTSRWSLFGYMTVSLIYSSNRRVTGITINKISAPYLESLTSAYHIQAKSFFKTQWLGDSGYYEFENIEVIGREREGK